GQLFDATGFDREVKESLEGKSASPASSAGARGFRGVPGLPCAREYPTFTDGSSSAPDPGVFAPNAPAPPPRAGPFRGQNPAGAGSRGRSARAAPSPRYAPARAP